MTVIETLRVKRFKENSSEEVEVSLIKEVPLTISLNNKEVVTLLCLGDHMKELALGFLGSEGFIEKFSDVKSIKVNEENGTAEVETFIENPLAAGLFGRR